MLIIIKTMDGMVFMGVSQSNHINLILNTRLSTRYYSFCFNGHFYNEILLYFNLTRHINQRERQNETKLYMPMYVVFDSCQKLLDCFKRHL